MNEQHGRDFLEYVSKNQDRLRNNLRKNITYDEDLFDDVTAQTIVKIYNRITSCDQTIDDFESYFFISSKFEYINQQNRKRKRNQEDDGDMLFRISHGHEINVEADDAVRLREKLTYESNWKEREIRDNKINTLFGEVNTRINEVFPPSDCDIFMIYYRLKSERTGISYKKLSEITGKPLKEITQIIQKLKQFTKNDEKILKLKEKILGDD